jgi:hypothetical protein
MKKILFLLTPFILFAETTFITPMEYASQLYKNPRGIGCQHCHGEKGEGKLIAKYVHKDEKRVFEGPAINSVDFNHFVQALQERKVGMPRYFLTLKEIKALYFYVQRKTQMQKDKDEK